MTSATLADEQPEPRPTRAFAITTDIGGQPYTRTVLADRYEIQGHNSERRLAIFYTASASDRYKIVGSVPASGALIVETTPVDLGDAVRALLGSCPVHGDVCPGPADPDEPVYKLPVPVEVRLRDGDACRYCGVLVDWRTRSTARSAVFSKVGDGPDPAANLVVACALCNTARGPVAVITTEPAHPHYGQATREWLAKYGIHFPPAADTDPTPGPNALTTTGSLTSIAATPGPPVCRAGSIPPHPSKGDIHRAHPRPAHPGVAGRRGRRRRLPHPPTSPICGVVGRRCRGAVAGVLDHHRRR